ncbi:hypothetical protein D9M69_673280 [compost metagenome]
MEIGVIVKAEFHVVDGVVRIPRILEVFSQAKHAHVQHAIGVMPLGERAGKFHVFALRDLQGRRVGFAGGHSYKLRDRLFQDIICHGPDGFFVCALLCRNRKDGQGKGKKRFYCFHMYKF